MARPRPEAPTGTPASWAGPLADASLIAAFLGLTFLLGAFPQKDFDLWFHLRTGDLIRQGQPIPSKDLYTFTVPNSPWIDLHWGFQVAASWVYAHAGFKGLNLAKCQVTCLAVLLLVTARRKDSPVWAVVLAWLPALFLLGGRMYVRPETLTLLYLSIFLAVLYRWERRPRLAFVLPAVQVFWVNTQGLFVLGPIVLGMALIDAALAPGAMAEARKPWWRTVGLATVLTGLACLANPYGLEGALFPVELTQTMNAKVFNEHIDELTSIPRFIQRHGLSSLPLQLHFFVMGLGFLSFALPMAWRLLAREPAPAPRKKLDAPPADASAEKPKPKPKARPRKAADREDSWRLRPFRVLLFVAFGLLSLKATRNSHQYAAVFGAITAWNFGEWAAAIRRRAEKARAKAKSSGAGRGLAPRALAFGAVGASALLVGSGVYYELAGEGRTLGLGEQPLWYPHAAAEFAGRPGMPQRMIGFHLGYPAIYEFYHGPSHKVFADPRLEVVGPELYKRYLDAQRRLAGEEPGWAEWLDEQGRPVVMVDNASQSAVGATLMGGHGTRWRCVYFDPIASVYLHEQDVLSARAEPVDFLARHFRPKAEDDPGGVPALTATATALWALAANFQSHERHDLSRSLAPLGLDYARRVREAEPDSAAGWKLLGLLEMARVPSVPGRVSSRAGMALDPVVDLSPARGTFALSQALRLKADSFQTLFILAESFRARGLVDASLPLYERIASLSPINAQQRSAIETARDRIAEAREHLGGHSAIPVRPNADELERAVAELLRRGRAVEAADLLERETPAGARPWPSADRLATLRLQLGEPSRARLIWLEGAPPPRVALRTARVALTLLVEGDIEGARRAYRDAIAAEPNLFEAHYGLATLDRDEGRAAEALASAERALALAPGPAAEAAARAIAEAARPFSRGALPGK